MGHGGVNNHPLQDEQLVNRQTEKIYSPCLELPFNLKHTRSSLTKSSNPTAKEQAMNLQHDLKTGHELDNPNPASNLTRLP